MRKYVELSSVWLVARLIGAPIRYFVWLMVVSEECWLVCAKTSENIQWTLFSPNRKSNITILFAIINFLIDNFPENRMQSSLKILHNNVAVRNSSFMNFCGLPLHLYYREKIICKHKQIINRITNADLIIFSLFLFITLHNIAWLEVLLYLITILPGIYFNWNFQEIDGNNQQKKNLLRKRTVTINSKLKIRTFTKHFIAKSLL